MANGGECFLMISTSSVIQVCLSWEHAWLLNGTYDRAPSGKTIRTFYPAYFGVNFTILAEFCLGRP